MVEVQTGNWSGNGAHAQLRSMMLCVMLAGRRGRELALLRHLGPHGVTPLLLDVMQAVDTDEAGHEKHLVYVTRRMDGDLHHIIHSKEQLTQDIDR